MKSDGRDASGIPSAVRMICHGKAPSKGGTAVEKVGAWPMLTGAAAAATMVD